MRLYSLFMGLYLLEYPAGRQEKEERQGTVHQDRAGSRSRDRRYSRNEAIGPALGVWE